MPPLPMPPLPTSPLTGCSAGAGCDTADVRHVPRSRVLRVDQHCGCGRVDVCGLCEVSDASTADASTPDLSADEMFG